MKIVRRKLDRNLSKTTLMDTDEEHGLIVIELGTMEIGIQEKDGGLYLNMTDRSGGDQLVIITHAANAITLKGI